jgi:hypothetical protein
MRLQLILTGTVGTIATILIITGCSKNSSPPAQADRQKEEAFAMALSMTNSPDALQKKYQENDQRITEAQEKLAALRKKYNIHDTSPTQLVETNLALASTEEPYWAAKHTLVNMIKFQKVLAAKIQANKIDEQLKVQSGSH